MEALAAIGLASNVLDFVDFGLKLCTWARQAHSLTTGFTEPDEMLMNVATELKDLGERLDSSMPTSRVKPETKAIRNLAIECTDVAEKILDILESFQAKNPRSKRESFRIAWRKMMKDEELKELEQKFDSFSAALNLHLIQLSRSETIQRLDQLIKSGKSDRSELGSLRRGINDVRERLGQCSSDISAATKLLEVLNISDGALRRVRSDIILNGLASGLTDERYGNVKEAHGDTFEWIFDKKSNVTDSKHIRYGSERERGNLNSEKAEFVTAFGNWLISGDGVFQIIGKPGSGKSTLMKFLCQHDQSRSRLRNWARPKELVFVRFFFWKSGASMQRSFHGFTRVVVHSIIRQCQMLSPDLISSLFPRQWADTEQMTIHAHHVNFEYEEVRQAFYQLMGNKDIYRTHRFAIFIDGLDEFESVGDGMADYQLVGTLKEWCSKCPGDIKMCLSSRELPVFQHGFPGSRAVRLQDLTRNDISSVIDDFVAKNECFANLQLEADQISKLRKDIMQKADGVFLWVVLVLHNLALGIINGDQLADLLRKVNTLPGELERLFEDLLTSIPKTDRAYAYTAIRVATETASLESKLVPLPLTYYLLLEKLHQHGSADALSRALMASWNVSNNSSCKSKINSDLHGLRKRVRFRCRGFLEIYKRVEHGRASVECVKLTHRSAVDFFKDPRIQDILEREPSQSDWFERLCQCVSAQAQLSLTSKFSFFLGDSINEAGVPADAFELFWALGNAFSLLIQCARIRWSDDQIPTTFIKFIADFESLPSKYSIPLTRQDKIWDWGYYMNLAKKFKAGWFEVECMCLTDCAAATRTYIDSALARGGIYAYFEDITWQQHPLPEDGLYLKAMVWGILQSETNVPRHIRTLAALLRRIGPAQSRKVSRNVPLTPSSDDNHYTLGPLSIWWQCLETFLFGNSPISWEPGGAILAVFESCVRHRSSDAEMQMWFGFGPQYWDRKRGCAVVFVQIYDHSGQRIEDGFFFLETPSKIVEMAQEHKFVLSLGHIFEGLGIKGDLLKKFPEVLQPPQLPTIAVPIGSEFKLPPPNAWCRGPDETVGRFGYLVCQEDDGEVNKGFFPCRVQTEDELTGVTTE